MSANTFMRKVPHEEGTARAMDDTWTNLLVSEDGALT